MTGGRMHSATVVPPVDVEKVALARWLALNARPVMQSALDYDKLADVAPTRLREEFGKNFWLEYAEEIIAALSPQGGWNEAIEAAAQWHVRQSNAWRKISEQDLDRTDSLSAANALGSALQHEEYAKAIRALLKGPGR
jgi:hypothetical protein